MGTTSGTTTGTATGAAMGTAVGPATGPVAGTVTGAAATGSVQASSSEDAGPTQTQTPEQPGAAAQHLRVQRAESTMPRPNAVLHDTGVPQPARLSAVPGQRWIAARAEEAGAAGGRGGAATAAGAGDFSTPRSEGAVSRIQRAPAAGNYAVSNTAGNTAGNTVSTIAETRSAPSPATRSAPSPTTRSAPSPATRSAPSPATRSAPPPATPPPATPPVIWLCAHNLTAPAPLPVCLSLPPCSPAAPAQVVPAASSARIGHRLYSRRSLSPGARRTRTCGVLGLGQPCYAAPAA